MKLLGRRKKRRPKKISMDVVKEDMKCVCVTEGREMEAGNQLWQPLKEAAKRIRRSFILLSCWDIPLLPGF